MYVPDKGSAREPLPNGSGTVVLHRLPAKAGKAVFSFMKGEMHMSDNTRFAARMDGITGSAIRELFKLTARPGVISFGGGNPSPAALPDEIVAGLSKQLIETNGKNLLQYGMTEGLPSLREALVPYIQEEFSVKASVDTILPVTGSTQAFNLLLDAYTDPGDVILTEDPTFLGAVQAMKLHQLQVVPVESDESGLRIEALEEAIRRYHPRMLYTIPTFQNPTGVTMPLDRRQKIAALAEKYDLLVAEDDPYHSLRYTGAVLPAIKSFDKCGKVALMGSFSKVISPGLRVGFLVCEPQLMRKCVICKQSDDLHTANLNQAIVEAYLRQNLLAPHVAVTCERYGAQMRCMIDGLSTIPGISRFTRPEGGLFIFAWLREGVDATGMLAKAVEKGVAYVPGTHFYPNGGHDNTLRLNFSNADIPTIRRGMELLRDCLQ